MTYKKMGLIRWRAKISINDKFDAIRGNQNHFRFCVQNEKAFYKEPLIRYLLAEFSFWVYGVIRE